MKYNLIILLCIYFLNGCSANPDKSEVNGINIEIMKIDSWFNLMPGGPSSFHIAGEVKIVNRSRDNIKQVNFDQIKIYLDTVTIYTINPFFNSLSDEKEMSLEAGEENIYLFGTKPALKIDNRIYENNIITAELFFNMDDISVTITIDSLLIEKAY